jgi:hypothetical protein
MRGRARGISRNQKLTLVALGVVAGLAGCGGPGKKPAITASALGSMNGPATIDGLSSTNGLMTTTAGTRPLRDQLPWSGSTARPFAARSGRRA